MSHAKRARAACVGGPLPRSRLPLAAASVVVPTVSHSMRERHPPPAVINFSSLQLFAASASTPHKPRGYAGARGVQTDRALWPHNRLHLVLTAAHVHVIRAISCVHRHNTGIAACRARAGRTVARIPRLADRVPVGSNGDVACSQRPRCPPRGLHVPHPGTIPSRPSLPPQRPLSAHLPVCPSVHRPPLSPDRMLPRVHHPPSPRSRFTARGPQRPASCVLSTAQQRPLRTPCVFWLLASGFWHLAAPAYRGRSQARAARRRTPRPCFPLPTHGRARSARSTPRAHRTPTRDVSLPGCRALPAVSAAAGSGGRPLP